MRVSQLELKDFRNYEEASVSFAPGLNLIVGRNGQGKTNLVEAISYFSTLASHRTSSDAALVRAGADAAIARMSVAVRDRAALLELNIPRSGSNTAAVNRHRVRPRELLRWFSSVMFAPEDLLLIRGEPSHRRRFFDSAIVSRSPAFAAVLSDYERVVRQRTSLLKQGRSGADPSALEATLGVWNQQLVDLGVRIMQERRRLIVDLAGPLAASYSALVQADHRPELALQESAVPGGGSVSRETVPLSQLVDVSRETLVGEFEAALERVSREERDRGVTLVGPHRDDVLLALNDLPVKGYASHGESWSYALSLKLALAELLRQDLPSGDPVIILDDVFAELDSSRRTQLMRAVRTYEQVIITAAIEEDVPDYVSVPRYRVVGGEVSSVDGHSTTA